MKKTACLPPTPKYEMSLLRDFGAADNEDDDDDDVTVGELSKPSWLTVLLQSKLQYNNNQHTMSTAQGYETIQGL